MKRSKIFLTLIVRVLNILVLLIVIIKLGFVKLLFPLISLSVFLSVIPSLEFAGFSLILGSTLLPLIYSKELYGLSTVEDMFLLTFSLILMILHRLLKKTAYVQYFSFTILPLVIILYVFHPYTTPYFFTYTIIGSIMILIKRKALPYLVILPGISFSLVQLLGLYAISFGTFSLMLSSLKFILPAIIVMISLSFIRRNDLVAIMPQYVMLISIALAFVLILINPLISLSYSSSAAFLTAFILTDNDIENLVLENITNNRLVKELLAIYEGDLNNFYCKVVESQNCLAIIEIPEVKPFKINYKLCDYNKIAECFKKLKRVPSRDIVNYLNVVKEKDPLLAENIGELALSVAPSPKLYKILDEIGLPKKDDLITNWDPILWVGREIYGYKVRKYLGKGGLSYVLAAVKDKKTYALKIPMLMPPSVGKNNYYYFINELSQLKLFSTRIPEVVRIVDVKLDQVSLKKILETGDTTTYLNEPPVIVMELMEGGSARDLIDNDTIFYSEEWTKIVVFIAIKIAKILKEFHSIGYVYLDMKPSNILFSKPIGNTGREVLSNLTSGKVLIKIGDVGSVRKIGEKVAQFTPEYSSIDQVEALVLESGADTSMDIYSLGATIYKMLTRRDFNPPELVSIYEEIVNKKEDVKPLLEKAKEVYKKYYESLALTDLNPDLALLIKDTTNPNKRPNIDEVIYRLERIYNSL